MLRSFIYSFLILILVACQPAPEPEKPKGLLRIATVPLDMPIIVDGQPKGNSPSGEGQYFSISLEEGEHKVEILKTVDEEKEQYAEKTIFIAADTVPIITLKAEERLTPFGTVEKARRDTEKAEKKRRVAAKRKKEAEIGKVAWSKTFGGSSYESAHGVAVDSSNNIWMVGKTGTYGAGSSDVYLVKTNSTGKELFSKAYGGAESDSGYGIALTNDGGAILVGEHIDKHRNYNIYVVKVSSDGSQIWEKSFGGRKADVGRAVISTSDNSFIIVGYADDGYNGYILKIDDSGKILWEKKFRDFDFFSIEAARDGNFLVGGRQDRKSAVVKINSKGEQLWYKTYGKKGYNVTVESIAELKDGYFLLGSDYRISEYDYDIMLRKVTSDGNILWEKRYDKTDSDSFSDVIALPDGGALLGGEYSPNPRGENYQEDIFITRIDKNGNEKWVRTYGRNKTEYLHGLHYTPDGGAILVGKTRSRGAGSEDVYLVRLNKILPEGVSP